MAKRRTKRTPTRRAAAGRARARSSSRQSAGRKRKNLLRKGATRRRSSKGAARKAPPVTKAKTTAAPAAPAPQQHADAELVREPGPGWWSALPKRATPARRAAAAASRTRPRGEKPDLGPSGRAGGSSLWPLAVGAILAPPRAESEAVPRPDERTGLAAGDVAAGLPQAPPVVAAPPVAAPVEAQQTAAPAEAPAVVEAIAPAAAPAPPAPAAAPGVEEVRDPRSWDSSNAVGDIGPEGDDRARAPKGEAPQDRAGEGSPQELLHELDQAIAQDVSTLLHGAYESVEELLESALDAPPSDEKLSADVGAEEHAIATIEQDEPAARPGKGGFEDRSGLIDDVTPQEEPDVALVADALEEEPQAADAEEVEPELEPEPERRPRAAAPERQRTGDAKEQKPPRPKAPARAEKPGGATALLQWLNTPLRFLPPTVRVAVDWIAISLLFWAPIVWLVALLVIGR